MILFIITTGKNIQLFVAVHFYLWRCLACKDQQQVFYRELFSQCLDGFQYNYRIVFCFNLFFWIEAVITMAAAFFIIIVFSKIMKQYFPAAYTAFGISNCFIDELCANFSFTKGFISHQVLKLGHI